MYKQNASLQNPTKGESGRFDHQRFVSVAEAERLVKSGCAIRVTAKRVQPPVYRMRFFPSASSSAESACQITVGDMRTLAGLQRCDEIKLERLIGFKLLASNTQLPDYGYL
jgi:hypothetical protein